MGTRGETGNRRGKDAPCPQAPTAPHSPMLPEIVAESRRRRLYRIAVCGGPTSLRSSPVEDSGEFKASRCERGISIHDPGETSYRASARMSGDMSAWVQDPASGMGGEGRGLPIMSRSAIMGSSSGAAGCVLDERMVTSGLCHGPVRGPCGKLVNFCQWASITHIFNVTERRWLCWVAGSFCRRVGERASACGRGWRGRWRKPVVERNRGRGRVWVGRGRWVSVL
jgi:hypothetical protein